MKTTRQLTIAAMSLAIVATLTLTSCKTTQSGPSGAHTMGAPQSGYKMADRDMPGRLRKQSTRGIVPNQANSSV